MGNYKITEKINKLKFESRTIPNAANLSLELQTKIDEIKSAADNNQSALAWNTVNEISG